ncbi:MAG: class I tRNA ligase family protein [Syntrophobacteraceae bacterium]
MLELYNTMTGKKETFKALEDGKVKIFTCGPSIYRRPHLGNYRTFLWEDVLLRYLEYSGYRVERVINFTDVEDKAINEADAAGEKVEELTNQVAEQFFRDTKLLGIKLPDFIPRSSTTVDEAARLIEILIEKGYAYAYENNIFFDPLKFKGFGKLSRLDMSRWPKTKKRFKKDTYPGCRWNLGDFILWHGFNEEDDLFWDTPIGRGRPSWNIQDPAVISKHLGFRIDIACGGIDNICRHHDYNIAIMESLSDQEFARYWVHGRHLLSKGKKMSKSLGNIIYPDDLFDKGYSPQQLRFYLLYGHHRKTINMTEASLQEKSEKIDAFRVMVDRITSTDSANEDIDKASKRKADKLIGSLAAKFKKNMDDDLNIKRAFDSLYNTISALLLLKREGRLSSRSSRDIEKELLKIDEVLQVIFP